MRRIDSRDVPLYVLPQVEAAGDEVGEGVGVLGVLVEGLEEVPLSLLVIPGLHVADSAPVVDGGLQRVQGQARALSGRSEMAGMFRATSP